MYKFKELRIGKDGKINNVNVIEKKQAIFLYFFIIYSFLCNYQFNKVYQR